MTVEIGNRLVKKIKKIPLSTKNKLTDKLKAIENVVNFSFLKAKKLTGAKNRYSLRVGDYRIVIKK